MGLLAPTERSKIVIYSETEFWIVLTMFVLFPEAQVGRYSLKAECAIPKLALP